MKRKLGSLKSELLYLGLILLVTLCFSYFTHSPNTAVMTISGVLGGMLIITWFVRAFALYSGRKISQYSEVIQRISIRERFFTYFILPLLFYLSLLAFLYFNTSLIMEIALIVIAILQIFVLFLNVKGSLKKIYSISSQTRAVFDFICISTFFLVLSVIVRVGLDLVGVVLTTFLFSWAILLADLKVHNKGGISTFTMSLLSAIVISVFVGSFWSTNIFVIPAIGTLGYYLIVSLWNVRFSGKYKLLDYLPPFIYVILALILVLNL